MLQQLEPLVGLTECLGNTDRPWYVMNCYTQSMYRKHLGILRQDVLQVIKENILIFMYFAFE